MLTKDEIQRGQVAYCGLYRKILAEVDGNGFKNHQQVDDLLDAVRGIEKLNKLAESSSVR